MEENDVQVRGNKTLENNDVMQNLPLCVGIWRGFISSFLERKLNHSKLWSPKIVALVLFIFN